MTDSSAGRNSTSITPEAAAELTAALPSGSCSEAADVRARHGRDETEDLFFAPDLVALPESTGQVATVLRWASRHGVPVTPQGARTGLSGGALPVAGGVALSLERLDAIRHVDTIDQRIEVEAGVVTADLQRAAADAGLYYPPDPASGESCQIGGNIAEDSAGPHSCLYGTTRQYVLGLEVVLVDGTVLQTGGGCLKNATGYNLTQLLVGSEGTLAVTTAATLRLIKPPAVRLAVGLAFSSLESAARAVVELFSLGVRPAACELMERRALELVAATRPLPEPLDGVGAFVLLDLDGGDESFLLGEVERVDRSLAAERLLVAVDARDRRRLWEVRAAIGHAVKAHSSYKEVDAVVPRSRLAELVRAARGAAASEGLEAVCYGHAGDGNLHVNLLRGEIDATAWCGRRDRAEDRLIRAVLELGGTITGEHGIGFTQRRHLPLALPSEVIGISRELKRLFDPQGILNPGKVLP